jgi:hypothetical protein
MDEPTLRSLLGRLGIRPGRVNRRGWIPFSCPLSPWTHQGGHDTRASAAALVAPEGISSFVCKGCHQHGRIAKLINLLATYRNDNSIRPLMLEADKADVQSTISAGFGEFERSYEPDEIEPLIEEQFTGLWDAAWSVPEARAYLEDRAITEQGAEECGLLWEPTQRRILFPVRGRRGELYGYSGRAIDPDTQPKIRDYYGLPKRQLILGEHRWVHGEPLILVEGLFGYAHLITLGLTNVGAILGSALTPEKAQRILDFDEPTYLLLDNDQGGDIGLFGTITPEGGREDNGAITQLQGHVPLFVPEWPDGLTDPDQLTLDHVRQMLAITPLYSSDGNSPFDKRWDTWQ